MPKMAASIHDRPGARTRSMKHFDFKTAKALDL